MNSCSSSSIFLASSTVAPENPIYIASQHEKIMKENKSDKFGELSELDGEKFKKREYHGGKRVTPREGTENDKSPKSKSIENTKLTIIT